MNYKELLPTRVPEFLQDDSNLTEFLEVAGELFDEFSDAIDEFDIVWDAAKVSEQRLRDLATQFAIQFPRNLNIDLQRTIIRDLEAIYQKSGTIPLINWVFRLIGWDIAIENAWLLNPEKYDPQIKQVFGLDDYGHQQMDTIITDYDRRDYRDFLIGDEIVRDNGTYFRGRRFFDQRDTFLKNEIVGEWYDNDRTRTADKVGATPYVFIRVSEEDYNIFISPYEDEDGTVYDYTQTEFFSIVSTIINFFLFDDMRPTHVRVVIIVTAQAISDSFAVTDDVREEWTADDLELDSAIILKEGEDSILTMNVEAGPLFVAGAPPHPYSKDMVISAIGMRKLINHDDDGYVNQDDEGYIIRKEEDDITSRCGVYDFRFVTPDEDSFSFRRLWLSDDTYEDFLVSSANLHIVVRNETLISSYIFNSSSSPSNIYEIGDSVGGEFSSNIGISMDFREGGETLADLTNKTFFYVYDLDLMGKVSNIDDDWTLISSNPTNQVNTLTEYNSIALRFREPIPYDFELNIEYLEQPEWENRP